MIPRPPRRILRSLRGGFSLVETLVALVVFGIAIALLLPSFAYFSRINSVQEDRSGAVRAVEEVIDELRATADTFASPPWPTAANAPRTETIANGFGTFVVSYEFCAESDPGCVWSPRARNVTATVSVEGRDVYELETIITQFVVP